MADSSTPATDCDSLVGLVTPPTGPVDAYGDWTAVETVLGTRLPDDYKRLVDTYGWGQFCDVLYLRTPFGTSKHNGIEWQSAHLTGSPEGDVERYPHPLRPAPGALLIWGTTMDADRLCWLTDGAPEALSGSPDHDRGRNAPAWMGRAHGRGAGVAGRRPSTGRPVAFVHTALPARPPKSPCAGGGAYQCHQPCGESLDR